MAEQSRRIVFRGKARGTQPGLNALNIGEVCSQMQRDSGLQALFQRFALEHETQSFGLYIGNEHAGDVLPAHGTE